MPAQVRIAATHEVLARLPSDFDWLSSSEQQRLQALRVDARRQHYLAGHWLIRELLQPVLGGAVTDIRLQERAGLPPTLAPPWPALNLSISHSGHWVGAAVASDPIGIDLEQQPRHLDDAIEDLLRNADEAPGSLSMDERLTRWVAKEAWIKALQHSALPSRLRQIQLHPTPLPAAIQVFHTPSLQLAVALPTAAALHLHGPVALQRSERFRVEDTLEAALAMPAPCP